jgi:hypothetical protein
MCVASVQKIVFFHPLMLEVGRWGWMGWQRRALPLAQPLPQCQQEQHSVAACIVRNICFRRDICAFGTQDTFLLTDAVQRLFVEQPLLAQHLHTCEFEDFASSAMLDSVCCMLSGMLALHVGHGLDNKDTL